MALDFKKEFKEYYMSKTKPSIITIPKMNNLEVRGKGNPNEAHGEYHRSIEKMYGVAYTIRMSDKTDYKIKDYFEYVVPPLEGFWWLGGVKGMDYSKKDQLNFISLIRLPDFVRQEDFEWAVKTATVKKKMDFSDVEFLTYDEGLCVQCLHIGPYDDEPKTLKLMEEHAHHNGYEINITDTGFHHEIYISDPSKSKSDNLKTVLRYPIKKIQ